MIKENFFAILGLGKSGYSAYEYLEKQNCHLVAFDDNNNVLQSIASKTNWNLSHYHNWAYEKLDAIVVSPGISLEFPNPHFVFHMANKYEIPLICDVDIFLNDFNRIKTIGITGTNGKSTTTALINHIFIYNKKHTIMGGNIGTPILNTINDDIKNEDNYFGILELSSYQLDLIHNKIHCALMLNIENDHLDHHGNFDNYLKAKNRIFSNQNKDDWAILNNKYAKKSEQYLTDQSVILIGDCPMEKGIYIHNGKIYDNYFENNKYIYDVDNLFYLKGMHNHYNVMFAYATARVNNIANIGEIFKAIESFKGLSHRQQIVASYNNILFVNDSKGTNQDSTYYALNAYDNIALILGGVPKSNDLNMLKNLLQKKVLKVFLIGQSQLMFSKILNDFHVEHELCDNLLNATNSAYDFLNTIKGGDEKTLLLSPACASFDQFPNFEERGNCFMDYVNSIISTNK